MSKDHLSNSEKRKIAEEAANILRRLDLDPGDEAAMRDRAEFISRGRQEKETFEKMSLAFKAAPKALKGRDRRYSLALIGVLIGSMYFAYDPVRVSLLADFRSQHQTVELALASGDIAVLDASSAILDDTQKNVRSVHLLKGAAYFDVETDSQRFVVTAGELRAEALGTEFEVAFVRDTVVVKVAEGTVGVSYKDYEINLEVGEQIQISKSGDNFKTNEASDIADWRNDTLVMDGISFADAASIIGRRLDREAIILNRRLASEPIVGVLDLSDPEGAMAALAATGGASILTLLGTIQIVY